MSGEPVRNNGHAADYHVCGHCKGAGKVELTGIYAETLKLVRKHQKKNGAYLAKLAKCKPTAMNNRLKELEKMGLAVGIKYGRQLLWRA